MNFRICALNWRLKPRRNDRPHASPLNCCWFFVMSFRKWQIREGYVNFAVTNHDLFNDAFSA